MRFLSTLIASTLGVLIAFGLLFFLFILFIVALSLTADQQPTVASGSVLVIELAGEIPEVATDDPLARAFGDEPVFDLRDFTGALRKAASDDRIEVVWLQVKGVDASWAMLQEMRTALLEFRASGKRVIASADDYMMGEAEYFVASAADEVYASKESLFEFNGFVVTVEFYKGLLDKLEVEPQVVRVGSFKSAVEPFLRADLSPENETQLRELLEDQNEVFLQAVSEARGLSTELLQEIATQKPILTAHAALDAGLLDGLAYRDEVEDRLEELLEIEDEDELATIAITNYGRIPLSDVGIETSGEGEVAIVYAEGAIVSGRTDDDPFGNATGIGAETFIEAMEEARTSERVKAVVLRINSPGGSASAADAMWRAIERTAAEKPVVVSMGGVAASGGYWIATAADTILVDPLTITGSIGVFFTLFDASGLFENKLGITFDEVSTSPYANLFSLVDELSPGERALVQQAADDMYETFLQRVAAGRGLSTERVAEAAEGRIWTGRRAVELDLADLVGDLEDAIEVAGAMADLGEGPYRTRVLPRPKTVLEQITTSLNARAAGVWLDLRATPAERVLLRQAQAVRQLFEDHATVQARLPVTLRIH